MKQSRLIEFYVLTSNQINQRISNGNETIYESKHHAVIKPLQSFDVNDTHIYSYSCCSETKIHYSATQMLQIAQTHIVASRINIYTSYMQKEKENETAQTKTKKEPTECDV